MPRLNVKQTCVDSSLYINVASYWLRLEIADNQLHDLVLSEYFVDLAPPLMDLVGHISVVCIGPNLVYSLKQGKQKKLTISIPKEKSMGIKEFLLLGFIELCLIGKNVFALHGSCLYKNKKLFMFIGPSGSGKTTIMRLLKAKNILSDDTIIIKYDNKRFSVYSSPFDKENGVKLANVRKASPINIFLLTQSSSNDVVTLDLKDKMTLFRENFNFFRHLDYFINKVNRFSEKKYIRLLHSFALLLAKKSRIQRLMFNLKLNSFILNKLDKGSN